MAPNILIPKKINVGFQNRDDTYTKKLAYVIYWDEKGKLRKEKSWNSWRDHSIEPQEFDNEPISGFVLNKKVGDYRTSFGHRKAYCRVYDPRGFEFEIGFENLLYILENANSIKGKGLEGEFVYGWYGTDVVLVPTESVDYKELESYNKMLYSKESVKIKDLEVGATYITKNNSKAVYLGKFPCYEKCISFVDVHSGEIGCVKYIWDINKKIKEENRRLKYQTSGTCIGQRHFFCIPDEQGFSFFNVRATSGNFVGQSDEIIPGYEAMLEELRHTMEFSPIDMDKTVMVPVSKDEFLEALKNMDYNYFTYTDTGILYNVRKVYRNAEERRDNKSNIYTIQDGMDEYYIDKSLSEDILRKDKEERFGLHYVDEPTQWSSGYDSNKKGYIEITPMTAEELYERLKPHKKEIHLTNGNLYKVLPSQKM